MLVNVISLLTLTHLFPMFSSPSQNIRKSLILWCFQRKSNWNILKNQVHGKWSSAFIADLTHFDQRTLSIDALEILQRILQYNLITLVREKIIKRSYSTKVV